MQAPSHARTGVAAKSPFGLLPPYSLLIRASPFDDELSDRPASDEEARGVRATAVRLGHRPGGLWLVDAAEEWARLAEAAQSAELGDVAAEARRHAAEAIRLLTEIPPGVFSGAARKLRARVITTVRAFGWLLADDLATARLHGAFCRAYDDLVVTYESPDTGSDRVAGLSSLAGGDRIWLAPDARLATSGWFEAAPLAELVTEPEGRFSLNLPLRVAAAAQLARLRHASREQGRPVAERELDVLYAAADLMQSVRGPLLVDETYELLGPQAWWVQVDPQTAQVVRRAPLRLRGDALVATLDDVPDRALVHALVSEPVAGSFSAWATGDAFVTPTAAADANARFLLAAVDQQPASALAAHLLDLLRCTTGARGSGAYASAVATRLPDRDPAFAVAEGWHDTLGAALLDRCLRFRAVTTAKLDGFERATASDGGAALATQLTDIAVADDVIGRSW